MTKTSGRHTWAVLRCGDGGWHKHDFITLGEDLAVNEARARSHERSNPNDDQSAKRKQQ